jgi:uncharacterized protein Smg (DUF494 family)
MYERIIEIIVYVVSELKIKNNINDVDITELQRRGYSNSEISTAFSWMVDRMEISERMILSQPVSTKSFRILHDLERELFTSDAWGEIVQMNTLGLINNDHIELLIERAAMMGIRQIDSSHLKTYIANIVFNANFQSLPGSRLMLSGSDTIN